MTSVIFQDWDSPWGTLVIGAAEGSIVMADWKDSARHAANLRRLYRYLKPAESSGYPTLSALIEQTIAELDEYFTGLRSSFDIPVKLFGTPFQTEVWKALESVGYAETISYRDLSQKLGCPRAQRAVASAVGSNPISIILPCHRIIGSNGSLTGYAGGLNVKSALLGLEKLHKKNF